MLLQHRGTFTLSQSVNISLSKRVVWKAKHRIRLSVNFHVSHVVGNYGPCSLVLIVSVRSAVCTLACVRQRGERVCRSTTLIYYCSHAAHVLKHFTGSAREM